MTSGEDPLVAARGALEAGRAEEALRLAWDATMPAVLGQDDDRLRAAAVFATELAEASEGGVREEARQNAAYWLACIAEPRDQQTSSWNVKSWFQRAPKQERVPCPECAELIVANAKVCRFCGHRMGPSNS